MPEYSPFSVPNQRWKKQFDNHVLSQRTFSNNRRTAVYLEHKTRPRIRRMERWLEYRDGSNKPFLICPVLSFKSLGFKEDDNRYGIKKQYCIGKACAEYISCEHIADLGTAIRLQFAIPEKKELETGCSYCKGYEKLLMEQGKKECPQCKRELEKIKARKRRK
jgi:hypothetical protein